MNRFFIPAENISAEGNVVLPDEVSNQIHRVLRLKDGDLICVLDNTGYAYETEISYLNDGKIEGTVRRKFLSPGESECRMTMYLSLTHREKFELMLQKCTETGASEFVPIISERSLARSKTDVQEKFPRWKKIIQEAAEQCERAIIPVLKPAMTFSEAILNPEKETLKLFFWEEENQCTLRDVIDPVRGSVKKAALLIGPEGGFSKNEAESARSAGWTTITLGKRIYRVETASIAASVLTLYELER